MVRRILLARHATALGRDLPIRIDNFQRLVQLLNEPEEFAKEELKRTSSKQEAALKPVPQKEFPFADQAEVEDDA